LHEKELHNGLAASQCYLWRNSWFVGQRFYNPSQVWQCPNSIRGGRAENLGFWPSPRKRK